MFNLYVKFDFAPEPHLATKLISQACLDLDALSSAGPFKLPGLREVAIRFAFDNLDFGLQLIRENIPKITKRVSEGFDVQVVTI